VTLPFALITIFLMRLVLAAHVETRDGREQLVGTVADHHAAES